MVASARAGRTLPINCGHHCRADSRGL
jgi:hypothetical protein